MIFITIVVRAVVEALVPTLNEIKNDLNSIRNTVEQLNETISCVNETVKTLAGEFEEHKDEIETELTDTQASIQSIIDNPSTDEISIRVLQLLLPYFNNLEEEIETKISETVNSSEIFLEDELMEYKKQTTLELANLQSSINANLGCVRSDLADLADLQSSINADFSCVRANLADLQSSIDTLNHINHTNTGQLDKIDTLQELAEGINNNITQVNATISSELTSYNTSIKIIS